MLSIAVFPSLRTHAPGRVVGAGLSTQPLQTILDSAQLRRILSSLFGLVAGCIREALGCKLLDSLSVRSCFIMFSSISSRRGAVITIAVCRARV